MPDSKGRASALAALESELASRLSAAPAFDKQIAADPRKALAEIGITGFPADVPLGRRNPFQPLARRADDTGPVDPVPPPKPKPRPIPSPSVSNAFDILLGAERLSGNGRVKLVMQGDGNLVLYVKRSSAMPSATGEWSPRWASNTVGQGAARCSMQGDGNLVLYRDDGHPVWDTGTWSHHGARLAIQDDENLVIYAGSNAVWSSNTWIGGEVRSRFDARSHGFRFINSFPDGYWQFGFLRFSTSGLCGGMSFSALDYFFAGRTIPADIATPSVGTSLGAHINGRQQRSVEQNLSSWMTQILNPDPGALRHWATHDEWNKLRAAINNGDPAPIGMGVYLNGAASHQIVATGYRDGANEKWILAYNPNEPGREAFVHLAPGTSDWVTSEGRTYRGYFVSAYSAQAAP